MKILITGGCGYKGSVLIPKLLDLNHKIINVDTMWFGNFLPKHRNLKNIKLDIRDIDKIKINSVDTIIHLASIANDPMSDLDESLSWEVGALGTFKLLNFAKKIGVKKFIYASSGSVYGIKKEKKVTEELSLKPISLYNKTKMICERVILSYKKHFDVIIIRPATVCGFSPRMRFDLTVNALTVSALNNKLINVNGGDQIRPNVNIQDLADVYLFFLKNKKFKHNIYNVGFENLSVLKIAKKVQSKIECKIKINKKNFDPRSYRLDSSRLLKEGFNPKKKIDYAIHELISIYDQKKLKNNPRFYSINWLKTKILKNGSKI